MQICEVYRLRRNYTKSIITKLLEGKGFDYILEIHNTTWN